MAGLIKIPDTFPIYAVKLLLIRPLARKVSRGGVECSGGEGGVGVQWGAGGPGVLGRERWGDGCGGGGVEVGGVSYCKGERRDTPTAISVLIASKGRRD